MADDNNIDINIQGNASGIQGASRQASSSVSEVSKSAKELDQAFRRLKSAIDPTFAAQEKYNQAVRDAQGLLAAKKISQEEATRAEVAAKAALDQTIKAIYAKSEAGRAAAAAEKQRAQEELAERRAAALAVAQEARAKAEAEKAAAQEARGLAKQKAEEEKAAIREAAREAKEAARQKAQAEKDAAEQAKKAAKEKAAAEKAAIKETEAEAKRAAREKAAAERAAAAEAKQAEIDARRQQKQAIREAAQAAAQAAADRRKAEKEAAGAARQAAIEIENQARAEKAAAAAASELRASIDPAYAAQTRYNETMRVATQLLMANKLQQGEWTAIQKQAAAQMEVNARSMGRLNAVYVQMGYQAQDVVASIASGINPLVILAQQGGQTAAALSTMGGKMGAVATFMAGPWGAAIMGGVMALGYLIPKLFDTENATEAAANAQKDFADQIDNATGRVKEQISWLERLAAAKKFDEVADKKRAEATGNKNSVLGKVASALAPTVVDNGMGGGMTLPAEISNGKSAAAIRKWADELKSGGMKMDEFYFRIKKLSATDSSVKKLADTVLKFGADYNKGMSEAEKAEAESARRSGKTLTARQRQILELDKNVKNMTTTELNAAVVIATSTDAVEKAHARLTVAEGEAARAREKNLAAGMKEAQANDAYKAAIKDEVKAVQDAEKARDAANKAAAAGKRANTAALREEAKERQEQLRFEIETYDYQKEMAVDSYNEQVKIQNKKIEALRAFYGTQHAEVVRAQRELERMERQHQRELLSIQLDKIQNQATMKGGKEDTDYEVAKTKIAMKSDTTDTKESLGIISAQQALQEKRQILEEEYQLQAQHENKMFELKMESLRQQLALLPVESRERETLNNQIEAAQAEHENALTRLDMQHARDVRRIELQTAAATTAKWRQMVGTITQSMSSAFQGLWTKSISFKQALFQIGDQIVYKFFDMGMQILTNWIMTQLGMKGAALATDAIITGSKTAATATQTAVGAAAATTEVGQHAAVAAAGAYKSTVVIPFIGPVAAPAAAALALAAVLGFGAMIASAEGGWGKVPKDGMITELHKDEMVLPAWIANPLRDSVVGPKASSGPMMNRAFNTGAVTRQSAMRGGDTFNIHAIDVQSSLQFLMKNKHGVSRSMKRSFREGASRSNY